MKKTVSLLLVCCLMLLCGVPAFAAPASAVCDGVIIVGFDGLGAMWETVDSPNFDRIFKNGGAYRYNAKTETVTISAQNWGSILTGVDADTHGITNSSAGQQERTADTDCKTVFNYARQAFPNARLVSYNHWYTINHGIIETDIGVEKYDDRNSPYDDQGPHIAQWVVDDLRTKELPKLMFVHFDAPDHAAHTYGADSDQYKQACMTADTQLGQIYDAAAESGFLTHGLLIVVADHGEIGYGHGGQSVPESSVVLGVAGAGVNKGVLPETVRNRDVAAIVLYALGIEQPAQMIAVVPEGLFQSQTAAPHTHDYGEGAVREQPTCTGQGTMVRVCRICGDVQYDPIAPRGHKDADSDGKCDVCGAVTDSSKSAKTDISNFFASIRDFFVRWFQWLKNLFR